MDILLAVIAVLFLLAGIVGCIVPLIPGPPLSFIGLLILNFTRFGDFSVNFMLGMAIVAAVTTLADLYLPVWFTRRYGGSRRATTGAMIGVVAGLFLFPPFGMIIGPLAGAFIGQMLGRGSDHNKAFRVAMGAFAAFLAGTGLKLIASSVMAWYGVAALF